MTSSVFSCLADPEISKKIVRTKFFLNVKWVNSVHFIKNGDVTAWIKFFFSMVISICVRFFNHSMLLIIFYLRDDYLWLNRKLDDFFCFWNHNCGMHLYYILIKRSFMNLAKYSIYLHFCIHTKVKSVTQKTLTFLIFEKNAFFFDNFVTVDLIINDWEQVSKFFYKFFII